MKRSNAPLTSPLRAALGLLFVLAACNGPLGLMAGGSLEGEGAVGTPPVSWDFAGESGLFQLETNPREPYSVNLAYTVMDGGLYINAGGTETQWAQNIAADPRVRVLMDESIYELLAERVTDSARIEAFAEAWTGQSFFRRDPRKYDEVWIFELVER